MSKRKLQSGMTLIEVLVGISMLGFLIVLYAATFNISVMSERMRNENVAYHIANKKIEELRALPYASLPSSSSFADPDLSQLPGGFANYTVADFTSYNGLKEFIVTVNWNDGVSRSIIVRSLSGSGGINQ